MDIRDKSALVTGASRGLGAGLARELARRGARVVMTARGADDLDVVARTIREEGGVAHVLPADIGDKRAIHPLAGAAAALAGPVDILIHNASELGPVPLRFLLDTECEDLKRVLAVNVVGPFRLTKLLAGPMALRASGLSMVRVTTMPGRITPLFRGRRGRIWVSSSGSAIGRLAFGWK